MADNEDINTEAMAKAIPSVSDDKIVSSRIFGIASELALKDGVDDIDVKFGVLQGRVHDDVFTVVTMCDVLCRSHQCLSVTWHDATRLRVLPEGTDFTFLDNADWIMGQLDAMVSQEQPL